MTVLSDDFKPEPYWWEDAPPPEAPDTAPPPRTEVLIVGSGYTGLHAALRTARGGRETVVVEAETGGWGCSSRNGGQVSTSFKPALEDLARRHGRERAFEILREGHRALDYIAEFIADERIDCRFGRVGRFHGAHQPAQYQALARKVHNQPKGLEVEAYLVPRAEQRNELGTDRYHGGVVYPQHAALHPALYHLGLLERAREAGVTLITGCRVLGVERHGEDFEVRTTRGTVLARDVAIATNGYTGPASPWHRRRVIPIGSYIIATEPIAPALMNELMPRRRVASDTRKLVYYYRPSPDGSRILFGGRVRLAETDPRASAPRLHAALVNLFPELAETRVTHSWVGFVAYTFDTLPHIGTHEGVHYAMGYCGSGVSLASYFGMRLGYRVLGHVEGCTPLDEVPFQTRPLYSGWPWFLAPSILYYQVRDRLNL